MSAATDRLNKHYYSKPDFINGTEELHALCARVIPAGSKILEIGAGPANRTSTFLASLGMVTGVDVSPELMSNTALSAALVYDGVSLPCSDASFDACVSNYVVEHVAEPSAHLREVARVLKPGGVYVMRTPNLYHYVAGTARILPHKIHVLVANRMRGLNEESHEPWPTMYRMNTRRTLRRLSEASGLEVSFMALIEKEPSYGASSALLFYPMMAYERLVNSSPLFAGLRSDMLVVLRKRS